MKYKVTYYYEGRVTVEVKAESEEVACIQGLTEADELISNGLSVVQVKAREA